MKTSRSSVVLVSTLTYRASHGVNPRGAGNWGFYVGNPETLFWATPGSTFSVAKKQAVAHARKLGADFVSVAS